MFDPMELEKLPDFPFVCPSCGSNELFSHSEISTDSHDEEVLECEQCEFFFSVRFETKRTFVGFYAPKRISPSDA